MYSFLKLICLFKTFLCLQQNLKVVLQPIFQGKQNETGTSAQLDKTAPL